MSTLQNIILAPEICHGAGLLLEHVDCKTWKYVSDISFYRFRANEEIIKVCDFLGFLLQINHFSGHFSHC